MIFWTAFFLGGDLLAVVVLLLWAVKKDREKDHSANQNQNA